MAAVQGLQFSPIPEFGLLEEFLLPQWEEMVEQPMGGDWSLDSPSLDALSSSRSDLAKSPGKISSSGGSTASHSPGGASRILTPASTSLLDFSDAAVVEDQRSDMLSGSPGSNVSPTDGYVHVPRDLARHRHAMPPSARPPPAGRSGVWSSTQPSHTSRESSVSQPTHGGGTHWPSFVPPPTTTVLMDGQQSGRPNSYHAGNELIINHGFAGDVPDDLLSNVGGEFDGSMQSYQTPDGLPFRTLSDGTMLSTAHPATSMSPHIFAPYQQQQHLAPGRSSYGQATHYQPYTAGPYAPSINSQVHPGSYAPSFSYPVEVHGVPSSSHPHPSTMGFENFVTGAPSSALVVPSNAPKTTVVRRAPISAVDTASQSPTEATPTVSQPRRSASNATSGRYPALVKAGPSTSSAGAQRISPGVTKQTARRGGRSKNSHLPETARVKSHEMRKVGACWRCVMQRDPCDHGDPCTRCSLRSQRGQQYFFDCDRSKLPDFVHDFLPPSMTVMHQKQTIEDCVNTQVLEWDKSSGLDVYLNSGYGPALRWKVYEFKPRTEELLWQLQYFQNPATGQSTRHQKYSPPFGLMKIDMSDSEHFETYLTELLSPDHLSDFGWNCYEEESQVDEGCFQASVLDLMCKLYQNSSDNELKGILRDILRMLIITYIMGHTLTIVHDTLYTVLSSVQHSSRPSRVQPFTSPRLANRQLKFFFSIQRDAIYKNVLRWQQATLHQAGKRENTWLSAFCVMLGFAMVLEEVQRTLQVQADSKANKGEMSPEAATREAYHACDRIDQRFKLLIGLFQCKYRDRRWGDNGSFGPGTPELRDPDARDFLSRLRSLVEARQDHLQRRENVTFSMENQCLYTTRLTARFLLPFLNLPPA